MDHPRERRAARRWGTATSRLVRDVTMADLGGSQAAVAGRLGVSQPRVSQVYALLDSEGVGRSRLDDAAVLGGLVRLYCRRHRPLVVSERLWYGLDAPRDQVELVAVEARKQGVAFTVSADLAPDFIAPWRRPTLTVVYVASQLDLAAAGFVPALAPGESTILTRETSDSSLLVPWPARKVGLPLAHPVQQVWDLLDLGGEDRAEAADRMVDEIVRRRGAAREPVRLEQ